MIYDITTKNRSFLKMSAVLRKRGVRNNKFFLALYDESLKGVDPYAKNLTPKQKIAIYREICINKWYFLREVVRVPVDGVLEGVPYKLNLGNLSFSYLKSKNKNIIEILPRQQGKTMGVVVDDVWNMMFASINANTIYLNKQFPDAKKNLKIFKDLRERLPAWLREMVESREDKDNEEYKLVSSRNNTLTAKPAATTDENADKLGRGMTTSCIWFDEFAFLSRNKIIYEACFPAWSTSSENAKVHGTPYGITITTTPNDLNLPQAAFCYEMIEKAAKWNLSCFDMNDEELDTYVEKNSSNNFIYIVFSYKELGKSEAWLQDQIRGFNGDLAKVKRELLLDWPISNENSVFSEAQLELIRQNLKPVKYNMKVDGYDIKWYETVDIKKNYMIGVDVSGGLSKDNSAIVFVDPEDFSIVASFKNNKIDTENLKLLLQTLMVDYFMNAFLIIEKNSFGLNILQALMKNPTIEPRLLQEPREKLGERTTKDGFTIKKKTKNIVYGVDTTVQSRKVMFELLPTLVNEEYEKFVTEDIYNDLAGLERKKTGKIEHSDQTHDDTLMAYLIVRYSLLYGNYLKNHGISSIPSPSNARSVLSSADIRKIEDIIRKANEAELRDTMTPDDSSVIFATIADQQKKMNKQFGNPTNKDEAFDQFAKILAFNSMDDPEPTNDPFSNNSYSNPFGY